MLRITDIRQSDLDSAKARAKKAGLKAVLDYINFEDVTDDISCTIKVYNVPSATNKNEIYTVQLEEYSTGRTYVQCDCKAGYHDIMCKHVAAVLTHIA